MTEYRAKTLFTGWRIGVKNGFMYVGVPDIKGRDVRVYFEREIMTIKDYEGFEKFGNWLPDKTNQNGGKDYRLAYFKWQPDSQRAAKPEPVKVEEEPAGPVQEKMFEIKPDIY